MAQGIQYVCGSCGKSIRAWDDGNPYYIDKSGEKQYAYHPDFKKLRRCVGNDSPHLCVECGESFMVDSRAVRTTCPACGSTDIPDTYALEGERCPFCKKGVFAQDPDFLAIS